MLEVKMTPKLLGFKISGDYDDLNAFYDAVFALTFADDDIPGDKRPKGTVDEQIMSNRLLSLCYDVRHAYMGTRNVELKDSGLTEWVAEDQKIPLVEKNVVYSVEVLYPEAMYEALALNYLIQKRKEALEKGEVRPVWQTESERSQLDPAICEARLYLSKLLSAVEAKASPGRFTHIRQKLTCEYGAIHELYQQWVDIINNDFVGWTPKRRADELSTIVRDIVEGDYHDQYRHMKDNVDQFARENKIRRDEVALPGLYEWEELEW